MEAWALLASVAVLCFIAGRLSERTTRLTETKQLLSDARDEVKALSNRLLAREGYLPVFTEDGIQVDRPIDDSPFQVLKPPFAAAEDRWEQEEQENRLPSLSEITGAVVPDLTDDHKAEMLNKYQQ